jgi:hypothetical protein
MSGWVNITLFVFAFLDMFVRYIILGIWMITTVEGFPWMNLKENEVNKLNTMLQDEEDNNLLDELNLLTERLYSNKQNMLKSENKLWSVDKNTPNIDISDKTSHDLALFLTSNPFSSCQEKYLIDMKQLIACAKEFEETLQNGDLDKRGKGMMKLNPTGWKRKRRDTLQTDDSARAKKSRKEYNINHLINRLLMQKRQKMRFNPTGW